MVLKNFLRTGWIMVYILSFQWSYSQYNFKDVNRFLDDAQPVLGRNICVMVMKDDNIVYSYHHGNFEEETPEHIASCSKWLTAALVMTFVDEGKLSLEDPVGKYLPEFNTTDKKSILIKHCLSHTTGIKSEPFSVVRLRTHRKFKTLAEEVRSFAALPMVGTPGKVFAYSSIGLNTVGRILEVISGKDFETLFQERIALPLGMSHSTFDSRQAFNPSGGATSTALDYMRFLEMILHKGTYHDKQILSEHSIAAMQESQTLDAQVLYTPEQAVGLEYGFGEWIHQKDKNGKSLVLSSPGLFGTYPYINIPGNYAAIVFVKNVRIKGRKETYTTFQSIVEKALNRS
jgi:CubicO group peptidase (beta-lactamase class C family)